MYFSEYRDVAIALKSLQGAINVGGVVGEIEYGDIHSCYSDCSYANHSTATGVVYIDFELGGNVSFSFYKGVDKSTSEGYLDGATKVDVIDGEKLNEGIAEWNKNNSTQQCEYRFTSGGEIVK